MVWIGVASHGRLAEELLNSAEMLAGPQEHVKAVCLRPDQGPEDLQLEYEDLFAAAGDEPVLILADLFGGTPCNVALQVSVTRSNVEVVAGVNLPMLLNVLLNREGASLQQLVDEAMSGARDGVVNASEAFRQQ